MTSHSYTIRIHPAESDEIGFWVEVPALPGCFTTGKTYQDAVVAAQDTIACYLAGLLQDGEPIPEEPRLRALAKTGGEVIVPVCV